MFSFFFFLKDDIQELLTWQLNLLSRSIVSKTLTITAKMVTCVLILHDVKRKRKKTTTTKLRHTKSPKVTSCGFQMKSSRMHHVLFTVSRQPVVLRLHFDLNATKTSSSVTALSLNSTQKTSHEFSGSLWYKINK